MRDFTLRFSDKADFRAFLRKLNWEEDEELQNAILVDEIGFTFSESGVSADGEPEYTRDEGYFVNIRLLDDGFDESVFREWVVTPERRSGSGFKGSRWISRRYFMQFVQ
ncbi:putative prophage protein [Escherichia coli]|nr:putative prophage protein [Escherichia coli]